jgi:general secretion pathway protein G
MSCSVKEIAVRRFHSRTVRAGFTLIELLVVIAIIAILAGLIVAGVMRFLIKGPETQTAVELRELDAAMQDFKTKWSLPRFPPDQLKLCKNYAEYDTTKQLDIQSLQFLSAMFPNLGNFSGIQWAGPGVTLPATGVVLEGDQVLVFCLGGPPAGMATPNLLGGFSSNPQDPIDAGNANASRKKNFNFATVRLKARPIANTSSSNFPSYYDPFNKAPYVYFGSDAGGRYSGVANSMGVSPYLEQASPKKFHNPNRFQLIAPCLDGGFGPGGVVWPGTAIGPPGADDMSNFADRKLGAS